MNILPWPKLHKMRNIVDTMHNTSVEIFEAKKRALENGEPPIEGNPWDGKDIISLLCTWRFVRLDNMLSVSVCFLQ